jgi:hypothetical protein
MLKEKTAAPPLHWPTPSKRWVNPPETRQLLLTASCPVSDLARPLLERHELPESNRAFELKRTLQRFQKFPRHLARPQSRDPKPRPDRLARRLPRRSMV